MTYEYVCQIHGRFEAQKPIADRHKGMCPKCGKAAELIMSVPAPATFSPALHVDSGMPMDVHRTLENKNHDRFEQLANRQGGVILPEDV